MELKAIISDIDGTLLSNDREITPRTKAAIIKAQEQGVKMILASGRPTEGIIPQAKKLDMDKHDGFLVSYNGAKIVDFQTNEVVYDQPLSVELAHEILTHLKKFDVIPMIIKDGYLYVENAYDNMIEWEGAPYNIIEYEARGGNLKICEAPDLIDFVQFPIPKILVACNEDYLTENIPALSAPFAEKANTVRSAPFYYEFTDKGIDKAKALTHVLPQLGIEPENIIAFGDGNNDQTMIEYAGLGVSMANGVDELKAVANEITASNNDDGIAEVLERYL